jgi:hypothetical protein
MTVVCVPVIEVDGQPIQQGLLLRTKPVFKLILTEVTVWSFCAFSTGAFP